MLKNGTSIEDGQFEGFVPEMLDAMGVDYQLVIPEDQRYGQRIRDEDGVLTENWTGMVGMVQREVRSKF